MIQIEKFSYLVSSSSQQGRQQVIMPLHDAELLLNDIVALQSQVITAQQLAVTTLQTLQTPASGNVDADGGRF